MPAGEGIGISENAPIPSTDRTPGYQVGYFNDNDPLDSWDYSSRLMSFSAY